MGHHLASLHASSLEFQNSSKVVGWRAGLSRGGTRWGHVFTWASPAMLSLFKLGMELSSSTHTDFEEHEVWSVPTSLEERRVESCEALPGRGFVAS